MSEGSSSRHWEFGFRTLCGMTTRRCGKQPSVGRLLDSWTWICRPTSHIHTFITEATASAALAEGCEALLDNGSIAGNRNLEAALRLAKQIVRADMGPASTLHPIIAQQGAFSAIKFVGIWINQCSIGIVLGYSICNRLAQSILNNSCSIRFYGLVNARKSLHRHSNLIEC